MTSPSKWHTRNNVAIINLGRVPNACFFYVLLLIMQKLYKQVYVLTEI